MASLPGKAFFLKLQINIKLSQSLKKKNISGIVRFPPLERFFCCFDQETLLWLKNGDCSLATKILADDLDQMAGDPQLRAREMVVESVHPGEGPIKQAGIPIKFSATPGTINRHSPAVGEHTEEILEECGFSLDQIRKWQEDGVV